MTELWVNFGDTTKNKPVIGTITESLLPQESHVYNKMSLYHQTVNASKLE